MKNYKVKEPIIYGSRDLGYKWLLKGDILTLMKTNNTSSASRCGVMEFYFCNIDTRENIVLTSSLMENLEEIWV